MKIEDENDTPPKFPKELYELAISEDRLPGFKVMTVEALDADLKGQLTYILVSGDNGDFNIDRQTGQLTVSKALDRENTPQYKLRVTANDGVQSSDVLIHVKVRGKSIHIFIVIIK